MQLVVSLAVEEIVVLDRFAIDLPLALKQSLRGLGMLDCWGCLVSKGAFRTLNDGRVAPWVEISSYSNNVRAAEA